jgi:hypothetical protein
LERIDFSSDFLRKIKTLCQNIVELKSVNIDRTFNIFTEISDLYWHENLHSSILRTILDPKTPVISDNGLHFLNLLLEKAGIDFKFSNNIKITTEEKTINEGREGRIDIFIEDLSNNQVVIIENKLNEANDMPDQLPRYYSHVKSKGYDLVAIIYIPLFYKEPPYNRYSDKYIDIIDNIKEITYIIEAGILVKWLDECVKLISNENDIARVFISQYSNLLKSLGENKMVIQKQNEVIEEAFKTEQNFQTFYELGKIWEERAKIAWRIIAGYLKEKEFKLRDNILIYDLPNDIILVFSLLNNNFIIGIGYNKIISDNNKDIIKQILENDIINEKNKSKHVKKWEIDKTYSCYHLEYHIDSFQIPLLEMQQWIEKKYENYKEQIKTKCLN